MSDFVAFFPPTECAQQPPSFSQLGSIFRGPLRVDHVQAEVLHGAALIRTRSFSRAPQFYAREDGAGWIVVKGTIFDVCSKDPTVNLKKLLHHFLTEDLAKLNNYEGTFALAAWDARKRQGWAVNDQTSILNLYYKEHEAGLYVSTNALSLARSLGLSMDPRGVQELLARNALLAPTTMFAGLRRINLGEHIRFQAGKLSYGKHWHAYASEGSYRSSREAAEAAAAVILDRVTRYASSASPMISDLTSGLDSRMVASAIHAADLKPTVTVNGPPDHEDVRIAHRVADTMRWRMEYYDTRSLWKEEITPDMRQELLHRTNGELPFTGAYHHLLSRPQLARDFNLHSIGVGGEFLRYHPWGQEFSGIGRRRPANVDNLLNYRFLTSALPSSLFSQDWLPDFRSHLKARIEAICHEQPKTRTTQQLDAVHVWKMTGHSSLYISAVQNWLPSVAPLLSAGFVKVATAMPWTMRLTSQLQRRTIYTLSPSAAAVATSYGGTAEPTSFKNLHLATWRSVKRSSYLARKLDRTLLKGAFTNRQSSSVRTELGQVPFLTREFREFLEPEKMYSRALYAPEALRGVLSGTDEDLQARSQLILRLATVEGLCRELNFEPDGNFLTPGPVEDTV